MHVVPCVIPRTAIFRPCATSSASERACPTVCHNSSFQPQHAAAIRPHWGPLPDRVSFDFDVWPRQAQFPAAQNGYMPIANSSMFSDGTSSSSPSTQWGRRFACSAPTPTAGAAGADVDVVHHCPRRAYSGARDELSQIGTDLVLVFLRLRLSACSRIASSVPVRSELRLVIGFLPVTSDRPTRP
jgi:hypothetical protein